MAGDAVRRGAARRPRRARPAGDGRRRRSRRSGRARRSRSRSRPSTSSAGRSRPRSSLALVDRSLLRLFGDQLPPIGPFFYDQTRTGAFATEATNTFRYDAGDDAGGRGGRRGGRAARWPQAANDGRARRVIASRRRRRWSPRHRPRPATAGPGRRRRRALSRRDVPAAGDLRGARSGQDRSGMASGRGGGMAATAMRGRATELGGRRRVSEARRRWPTARRAMLADVDAEDEADGRDAIRLAESDLALGRCRARRKAGEISRGQPRERFVETAYWNPARRHRQGRQGHASRSGRRWPSREYRFTARGVTGADTLVGQTTADLDRPQGLLRRPQGPRRAHPGGQAPVRRPRSTTSGVDGHGRASGWRSTPGEPRAGLSRRRSTSRTTASTRSSSSRSRSPTARTSGSR